MPRRSRAKKPPVSESEDDSDSENSRDSSPPSKDRRATARSKKAGPSGTRKPLRRKSMPGAWESVSDEDAPKKGKGRRDGRARRGPKDPESDEDDEDDEDDDHDEEEARQPRRRKQMKARGTRLDNEPNILASRRPKHRRGRDPIEDEEAQDPPRRRTARASSQSPDPGATPTTSRRASPIGHPSSSRARHEARQTEEPGDDFETQMRQALAKSLAEPQAKPSDDVEEDAAYLEIIERSRREHEAERKKKAQAAKKLAEKHEAQFERALKLSEQDSQVPQQQEEEEEFLSVLRLSEQTAAEDVRRAAERMAEQKYVGNASASWGTNNPRARERHDGPSAQTSSAAQPAAARPNRTSRRSINPFSRNKRSKQPALGAVPGEASASSPTPGPSASSGAAAPSNNNQIVARRKPQPIAQASPQAVATLPKPPITIEKLLRMCERAFPQESDIDAAVAESVASHRLEGMDVDPDQMAQAMAESLRDPNREVPLDITDIGLEDGLRPPDYKASQTHRIVNHFKFTSSDYRREKMGRKWPITTEILEIMRLWKLLLDYTTALHPDPKGKGKEQQQQPLLLDSPASPTTPIDPSLTETSRPALRTEFTAPDPAAANTIMASVAPAHRGAAARMQNQSVMIGQSRIPGMRPRAPPEAHLAPFARLPILVEGNAQVGEAGGSGGMGRGTRRRVERDRSFRRRGI
ncbi:MAG: hypothetical protein Q9182_007196 [Xanthomendoza sp. 2 TL-2023]